jgi:predicted nucleic acid-binding protein
VTPVTPVTADTSLVIPAVTAWHEAHEFARNAVQPVTRLPAHVILEAVAVLTRLPHGLAVPSQLAVDVVRRAFPGRPFTLPATGHERLITAVARAGLRGGLVYDALVGATAAQAGARLLTLDRRAEPAYRAVGADLLTLA